MKINLVNLEGVRNVGVVMPRKHPRYRYYEGHEEEWKMTWWGGKKLVREEVEEGWTYSNREFPNWTKSREYFDELEYLFIRDNDVWLSGEIVILYENGESYKFYSESEQEINDYLRMLRSDLGESFIEFIEN